jgi:hypothetical protein
MDWELQTYRRILALIGGQESVADRERAKAMMREFLHWWPTAKAKWDAELFEAGMRPVPPNETCYAPTHSPQS